MWRRLQRRALGRLGRFLAAAGRLWGSLRPQALAQGPGGDWRSGWVGVAHATGKCALVHKIGSRPPPGPPRTIGADRAARCWAESERRGRVGVAHAIRICALVLNISQAWGSNPPAWLMFKGWGTHPATGLITG